MRVLLSAWHAIRRNSETSKSPRTREDARKFGRDLPLNLRRIQDQLRNGYRFRPAKGATPAKGAGKAGKRPLVIAPLADRIVQRAILDVLQDAPDLPAVREVLSIPTSIGGIRYRGVDMALDLVDAAFLAGAKHVAGSDIAGFFTKIPRQAVADFVRSSVNDDEFADLFERAMTVELENADALASEDLHMFPTGADGVAQGCPLSAFAGNVVLREFDAAMNDRGVTCIRYIDDFIVLAANRSKVVKAMASAKAMLTALGMETYDHETSPKKAFLGEITEGKVFLGYEIIPGLYPPSPASQAGLLTRIEAELKSGKGAMRDAAKGVPVATHAKSYAYTLAAVDKIIHGWASSFRRSRCQNSRVALDHKIDRLLNDFELHYRRQIVDLDAYGKRRVTGVRLLQDSAAAQDAPTDTFRTWLSHS
jgi:RNA-directed DNA polymerase